MSNNVLNYQEQAGSGSDNKFVFGGSVETTGGQSLKKHVLYMKLADISTGSSAFIVSPVAGTISKISSVIDGAIISFDDIITTKIGGTTVTNGGFTIAFADSAAGVVDSNSPTALNTVAIGDVIRVSTDGASTNTVSAQFTIEINLT